MIIRRKVKLVDLGFRGGKTDQETYAINNEYYGKGIAIRIEYGVTTPLIFRFAVRPSGERLSSIAVDDG